MAGSSPGSTAPGASARSATGRWISPASSRSWRNTIFAGWAVLEWECCIEAARGGAREGAPFIARHIIRAADHAFDDFAGARRRPGAQPRSWADLTRDGGPTERNAVSRLGMVGGGPAPSSARCTGSRRGSTIAYELVAGALSSDPQRAPPAAPGGIARRPQLCRLTRDGARAERRAPMGSTPLRSSRRISASRRSPGVSRSGHPCHLRQAADDDRRRCAGACRDGARAPGCVFGLTHNYTGYPMVRQARDMVAAGELGELRVVQVEYAAGLADHGARGDRAEAGGVAHRPGASGPAGCLGDIGTHAFHLAAFVTGLTPEAVAADLHLRARTPPRRQCPCAAALFRRRARHAVGEPGRARQRQRSLAAGLWRRAGARMAQEEPGPPAACRRSGEPPRSSSAAPARARTPPLPPTPSGGASEGTSRPSRSSIPIWRSRSRAPRRPAGFRPAAGAGCRGGARGRALPIAAALNSPSRAAAGWRCPRRSDLRQQVVKEDMQRLPLAPPSAVLPRYGDGGGLNRQPLDEAARA